MRRGKYKDMAPHYTAHYTTHYTTHHSQARHRHPEDDSPNKLKYQISPVKKQEASLESGALVRNTEISTFYTRATQWKEVSLYEADMVCCIPTSIEHHIKIKLTWGSHMRPHTWLVVL